MRAGVRHSGGSKSKPEALTTTDHSAQGSRQEENFGDPLKPSLLTRQSLMFPIANWGWVCRGLLISHFILSCDFYVLLSQGPRSYEVLAIITILVGGFPVFFETEGPLDSGIWGEDG